MHGFRVVQRLNKEPLWIPCSEGAKQEGNEPARLLKPVRTLTP